ncbi:MAG: GNAT family N-acetyltransferase [Anaerolineae bacterium]|nr:MAG: glyoxalase/bleomycin resistance protein/dioxygenase [Chloroflexi bacterium OLB13]MBV6436980.1 hypothetical protein [Anaerolineae bacterium]MBW7877712.1 GNAT family N-acetyltransferase [Anaerolineae bacterium]
MSGVVRLHHAQITVPPDQVAGARAFYLDVLGLSELPKPDSLIARGGFWAAVGDQQLHVGVEQGADRTATKAHLAYEVDDLAAWRAKLEARGITAQAGEPIPGYDRFEFRDPFGNRVEFIAPIVDLVRPHARCRASFLEAVEEFKPEGRYLEVSPDTFDSYLARLLAMESNPPAGYVADTALWLMRGDHFIGRLSIRHHLNAKLERFGGHVGYELRPTERGKGYGTLILRLGLEHARRLGFRRVMLTTDVTNERSIRVIKANGGTLQDRIRVEGRDVDTFRWWIEL